MRSLAPFYSRASPIIRLRFFCCHFSCFLFFYRHVFYVALFDSQCSTEPDTWGVVGFPVCLPVHWGDRGGIDLVTFHPRDLLLRVLELFTGHNKGIFEFLVSKCSDDDILICLSCVFKDDHLFGSDGIFDLHRCQCLSVDGAKVLIFLLPVCMADRQVPSTSFIFSSGFRERRWVGWNPVTCLYETQGAPPLVEIPPVVKRGRIHTHTQ